LNALAQANSDASKVQREIDDLKKKLAAKRAEIDVQQKNFKIQITLKATLLKDKETQLTELERILKIRNELRVNVGKNKARIS